MMHHVIVGTGIAALSAAESIRRADARTRITMIGPEATPFYSRPGLAYLLTDEIPGSQLALRTEAELEALDVKRMDRPVTRLDTEGRFVQLDSGVRIEYDRLLLATGAVSLPADFPGATLDGVVRLDNLGDANDLVERTRNARAAVVIGGGSTALELVDGLYARGLSTHYLMRGERYWSKVLDAVESAIVEARLLAQGILLHRRTAILEAIGLDGVLTGVRTSTGRHIACDILGVAVGVMPRIELARAAGLATDRGILTNEYLETSAPDIFAAGDVAQVHDPVTQRALLDTLWASALQQGRIAGLNMAGVRVALRKRTPMNVTRVAGITTTIVGAVGAADDPDLLTLTRGQSERWTTDDGAWSVGGSRMGNRLRVVVSGRAIVGAVVMGDQRMSQPLAHLIGEEVDIAALRPALEASPDDAMDLFLAFCETHVTDHAAHHG
ncbi:MAG: FAD-dependent oxidoreductase [Gemmatimonas sp.]